jgi:hypothetical protein
MTIITPDIIILMLARIAFAFKIKPDEGRELMLWTAPTLRCGRMAAVSSHRHRSSP